MSFYPSLAIFFPPAAVYICPLRLPSEDLLFTSGHMQSGAQLSVAPLSSTLFTFVNPVNGHVHIHRLESLTACSPGPRVLPHGEVDKALAHQSLLVSLHAKKLPSANVLFYVVFVSFS